MLLRRITQHVKDQNWFAVALDFFIVVAGILIALQVSNWNENRIERELEQDYINRIQSDLLANKEDMKTRVAYFSQVRTHALAALDDLEKQTSTRDEQFLIDSFIASFALVRPLQRHTYDELLSAGAMSTISDVAIRDRIAEYYRVSEGTEQFFNSVPPYGDVLARIMPYRVSAKLRAGGCNANFSSDATGTISATIPQTCSPGLSPEETVSATEKLLSSNLGPELSHALTDFDLKLRLFRLYIDRSQNLYDYLEETK